MISGSIVALVTPFNEDFTVNYALLEKLILFQIENKTDAIVLLGSTAESTSLDKEEKMEIVKRAIKINNKQMKVIVASISNKVDEVIKYGNYYTLLGADAIMITNPFYSKANESGLYEYFHECITKINNQIILYNVPSRTGYEIGVEVIKNLLKLKNLIGIKESSKNIEHILDLHAICNDGFNLYCGNDDLIYLFLGLNAKGFINVFGNVKPDVIKNIIKNKDNSYYNLFKVLNKEVNPIAIKALMNYENFNVGGCRNYLGEVSNVVFNEIIIIYSSLFC